MWLPLFCYRLSVCCNRLICTLPWSSSWGRNSLAIAVRDARDDARSRNGMVSGLSLSREVIALRFSVIASQRAGNWARRNSCLVAASASMARALASDALSR